MLRSDSLPLANLVQKNMRQLDKPMAAAAESGAPAKVANFDFTADLIACRKIKLACESRLTCDSG